MSKGKKIVFDETLINDLQNDNIVIDDDQYDLLRNMFSSEDTSNHKLAMEVMANCNYEKSKNYLFILRVEFRNLMSYGNENFKFLMKYLGDGWKFLDDEKMIGVKYILEDLETELTSNELFHLTRVAQLRIEKEFNIKIKSLTI
jgi:hypothetical protein